MNDKKKDLKNVTPEIVILIEKKILFFQDVIQKTILHVQNNKVLDIIGISEVNSCINTLLELSNKIKDIPDVKFISNTDLVINVLQNVNNELSSLFKLFGTSSFEDLLWICFGNNSVNTYAISDMDKHKFELLKKYFHPIGYKILSIKNEDKKDDDSLNEKSKNLDSIDISIKTKQFHLKVYGIQLIVHNPQHNKSLIINGIVDEIIVDILNNRYINLKIKAIKDNIPNNPDFQGETFSRFVESLSLKDYLIYEPHEIYLRFAGIISNVNNIRQKNISQIVKDFISVDLFLKRITIIHLLIKMDKYDNQYLAYLLYDILSNDINGNIDTQEQTILFDSFPWPIKQYFKDAMKNTVQYTNKLSNFDVQKIPLEQQICLLKVGDNVKEKAMQKLKEVKSKSEDSCSKARQYLDGLLKIPFNIYKKEPILNVMNDIRLLYINMVKSFNLIPTNKIKTCYTSLEISNHIGEIKKKFIETKINTHDIKKILNSSNKSEIVTYILKINEAIQKNKLTFSKIKHSNKTKDVMICSINEFVSLYGLTHSQIFENIFTQLNNTNNSDNIDNHKLTIELGNIESKYNEINKYMLNVKNILDEAVYGHDKAKKQIERIVGQWINGKLDGYCFGFEGPPGTGKTSIAKKGLSNCLKDENGVSRPFAMIQMGGDANGSSLHGHNYTYVGSTWGSIVQILIDKKCMNPIIFIDEIDKISKTEHGKEIIGILIHLLDPSQNDCFQDKYFSGIDLDLSKALFVLSYNDVDSIDKILLDRIHRIKFKGLTLDEKIVISRNHILPEVFEKVGLQDVIKIDDQTLKYIIDEYTAESGVRKLKEILFEIVAEINLDILKKFGSSDAIYDIPINVTIDDIKNKYFKDKQEIKNKKIHNVSKVGIINGLWANALGKGGVIPIQSKWRPSEKFLCMHLTGMQGDVMKESMNVALTLAWNLTPNVRKEALWKEQSCNLHGVHIHCPEGSTPKDGPSAGTAITVCLYSLFNNKKIKYDIAITGEITLDGCVTEIGGLELKILGGIKAGIKQFIYPIDNQKDFDSFMEKYKDDELTNGIIFHSVEKIEDVLNIVFDE
jgi:ATP-dependent Lon protease